MQVNCQQLDAENMSLYFIYLKFSYDCAGSSLLDLSLVGESGDWSPTVVLSFSLRGLLLSRSRGSRAQTQCVWPTGLAAPWRVGSSPTRDGADVPCVVGGSPGKPREFALLKVKAKAKKSRHILASTTSISSRFSYKMDFPGGAGDREPACRRRRHKRHRFSPWVGKIPWWRPWQPTAVFLPRKFHGQRSLEGYSP